MNAFEQLLLKYPSAPWDWRIISTRVSFQFILTHSNYPWIPRYVSESSYVYESDVIDNPEYPWCYEGLCANPNMSIEFYNKIIINHDAIQRIEWNLLSANPCITMFDVIQNPRHSWNHRYLSANPNLSSNFILTEGKEFNWFVPFVSANKGITSRDILKSTLKSMFDWDYKNLSANKNLPTVYVNNNINRDWNFHSISTNASLTDIQQYRQIKWDGTGLSMNSNMTIEYVKSHPTVKWHWYALLSTIPFSDIIKEKQLFEKKINEPLTQYLCLNPTITVDWIEKNYLSVDWKKLSHNSFCSSSNGNSREHFAS